MRLSSQHYPNRHTARVLIIFILMGLAWWFTRLPALDSLPLHNDEGLHLSRAVEVWHLHPFWEIRDGKIVNQFVIAAFYPQNEPVFVGRIATLFVVMIGLAAGFALIRRRFGIVAGILAGAFWITSAYLLFFERLAFSDAETGALVVLALWASDRLAHSGKLRDALLTGLCFGTAALFKFTAIPFSLSITVVILLTARYPLVKRLQLLIVIGLVTAALFVIPLAYLILRGEDLFSIALGWIGVSGGTGGIALFDNIARLWITLTGFAPTAAVLLVIGLVALGVAGARGTKNRRDISRPYSDSWVFLLALALPLGTIMIFGKEVLPRHFIVVLPLALILAGAGFARILAGMENISNHKTAADAPEGRPYTRHAVGTTLWGVRSLSLGILLASLIIPFAINLPVQWNAPDQQPLPDTERHQFIIDHSSGYGLREAVQAFPQTVERKDIPIVASMFGDSCRRANFYAVEGLAMFCTDAPGTDAITSSLNEHGAVYVLVETAPIIGADMPTLAQSLGGTATLLANYPRPGETVDQAAIKLWLLEKAG